MINRHDSAQLLALTVIWIALLSGCVVFSSPPSQRSPLFGGTNRTVLRITSDPSKAKVYYNGAYAGDTPMEMQIEFKCNFFDSPTCKSVVPINLRVELGGFTSATRALDCVLRRNRACVMHFVLEREEQAALETPAGHDS